ncbi:ABC transporter ATP-binding protein [Euzebya sp.]|uniref:ABC transporter ATP-binding protein n=1 Tax=Euzebya sp. TaxID=1971409 RepID=UPI0035155040
MAPTSSGGEAALSVRDLHVAYATPGGMLGAVDGVSFDLARGESLGVVGESGCGKSTMGKALMQLLPPGAEMSGSVVLDGEELVGTSARTLRRVRGDRMSLVFQEPMTRLDPLMKVSDHFVEAIRAHRPRTPKADARRMAREALANMGIPPTRADNYPHEFSGGMRQRIMIALGIVMQPAVVIADEPTTALDVIVEAQILDLLDRLRSDEEVGLILITHNLGIVAETCDRVAVMYAGRIVEIGPVEEVFAAPAHPYTQGLLRSVISVDTTELASIDGSPPNLIDPPDGCRFAPRCDQRFEDCPVVDPVLGQVTPATRAACLLHPTAYPARTEVAS